MQMDLQRSQQEYRMRQQQNQLRQQQLTINRQQQQLNTRPTVIYQNQGIPASADQKPAERQGANSDSKEWVFIVKGEDGKTYWASWYSMTNKPTLKEVIKDDKEETVLLTVYDCEKRSYQSADFDSPNEWSEWYEAESEVEQAYLRFACGSNSSGTAAMRVTESDAPPYPSEHDPLPAYDFTGYDEDGDERYRRIPNASTKPGFSLVQIKFVTRDGASMFLAKYLDCEGRRYRLLNEGDSPDPWKPVERESWNEDDYKYACR